MDEEQPDQSNSKNEHLGASENCAPTVSPDHQLLPTRKDFQLPRRLFHFANGAIIGTLYLLFFTYQTILHIIGIIACLAYITEQIRLSYPVISQRLLPITRIIMRAEEQLKESAMVPYAIAILLTIITFPKEIAIISIFTLAVADPMSALVGIRYGGTILPKIVSQKSLEGSLAFFLSTFVITLLILLNLVSNQSELSVIIMIALMTGFIVSAFEMIPLNIDDNLTIPLFTSLTLSLLFWLFEVSFI